METEKVGTTVAWGALEEEQDCTEFVRDLLSDAPIREDEYADILQDCDRFGVSERDLWQRMALYLQKGVVTEKVFFDARELSECYGQKLRRRILALIGKLPQESLEEFRGLMTFTASFLQRVEFLCDLVVYLFAEREKGTEREDSDKGIYIQFFAEKLMWELDVIGQVAEGTALQEVNGKYWQWLEDRIIDGEVLI